MHTITMQMLATAKVIMIKYRSSAYSMVLGAFIALGIILTASIGAFAEPGCRTGALALANAYVRANPLYAIYFGSIQDYVAAHSQHFVRGADAIRCAQAVSNQLLAGAIASFDPKDIDRKRALDARLGSMGISPGPAQPSVASQFYMMGQTIARLARVLPPAARGDWRPFFTPTTQLEQMQFFATQMLQMMMQDPSNRAVLASVEPVIKESANLEFKFVTNVAARAAAE
jgi:hypothetical protein